MQFVCEKDIWGIVSSGLLGLARTSKKDHSVT
jgi:hypothetical protein